MKKEMFFLHESWTRRKNIQVTQQESNLKLPGELSALTLHQWAIDSLRWCITAVLRTVRMSRVKAFFFLSLRTSFLYFISEPNIHHRSYSNRLISSLLILGAFRSGVMQESYPRNNFPYFDFLLQIIKTIKRNLSDPLYQSKFLLKQLWTSDEQWV